MIPLIVPPCPCCGNTTDFARMADDCVFCLVCGDVRDPEPLPGTENA